MDFQHVLNGLSVTKTSPWHTMRLRTPKIPNPWTSESCKMQRFNVRLVSFWEYESIIAMNALTLSLLVKFSLNGGSGAGGGVEDHTYPKTAGQRIIFLDAQNNRTILPCLVLLFWRLGGILFSTSMNYCSSFVCRKMLRPFSLIQPQISMAKTSNESPQTSSRRRLRPLWFPILRFQCFWHRSL